MAHTLRFGVATADHQCEAYDGNDDIRDVWERVRGLVPRGNATDFWNRFPEDIRLARGLGCTVFRLSLSWARLEPEPGVWNDETFAHYRDVLQAIRDAGMSPIVTLVHNTWPLHVQADGPGAGAARFELSRSRRRYAGGGRTTTRRCDRRLRDAQRAQPARLRMDQGLLDACVPMPPGAAAVRERRRADGRRPDADPNLFRAHAKARDAVRRIRPDARVGANPLVLGLPHGCSASSIVTRRTCSRPRRRSARRHGSRNRRSSKVATSIARSRSSP